MGVTGFWDDPEAAGRAGAEHARLGRRLETFEKLQADAEDLDGLVELAEEDEEIGDYVRALEETRDTTDLPEASGEAIAREFERYLKRRGSED